MERSKLARFVVACGALAGVGFVLVRGTSVPTPDDDLTPEAAGWFRSPTLAVGGNDAGGPASESAAHGRGVVTAEGEAGTGRIQRVDGRWWTWGRMWGRQNDAPQPRRSPQYNQQPQSGPQPSADNLAPQPDPRYQGGYSPYDNGTAAPSTSGRPSSRTLPVKPGLKRTADRNLPAVHPPDPPAPPSATPPVVSEPLTSDVSPPPNPVAPRQDFEPVRRRGAPAQPVVPPFAGTQPAESLPARNAAPPSASSVPPLEPFVLPDAEVPKAVREEQVAPNESLTSPPAAAPPRTAANDPPPVVEEPVTSRESQPVLRSPQPQRPVIEEATPGPLLVVPGPNEPINLQPVPRQAASDAIPQRNADRTAPAPAGLPPVPADDLTPVPRASGPQPPAERPARKSTTPLPPPTFEPTDDPFPAQPQSRNSTAKPNSTGASNSRSNNQNPPPRITDGFRKLFPPTWR